MMYHVYKILVEGENYTLGNVIMFFFRKNYSIVYSNYEVLHPMREVLILSITLKKGVKIKKVLKKSLKIIKMFLKMIIKIIVEGDK